MSEAHEAFTLAFMVGAVVLCVAVPLAVDAFVLYVQYNGKIDTERDTRQYCPECRYPLGEKEIMGVRVCGAFPYKEMAMSYTPSFPDAYPHTCTRCGKPTHAVRVQVRWVHKVRGLSHVRVCEEVRVL